MLEGRERRSNWIRIRGGDLAFTGVLGLCMADCSIGVCFQATARLTEDERAQRERGTCATCKAAALWQGLGEGF